MNTVLECLQFYLCCKFCFDIGEQAWHENSSSLVKKGTREKNTKQSGKDGFTDARKVSSIIEDYGWMVEHLDDASPKIVEISKNLFKYDHRGISITKEQLQIWLEEKEIGVCHVSLYMR